MKEERKKFDNKNYTKYNADKYNYAQSVNLVFIGLIFVIMVGSGFIGITWLGYDLGEWIVNKLGWYTDFELDRAEKKVKEIKEALNGSQI